MFTELPQPKMRWRFFEPGIPSEEAERARVESCIAAWWSDFAVLSSDVDAAFKTDGADWNRIGPLIEGHLTSIANEAVSWEFGPGEAQPHRFSLTAGWDYSAMR